jgi:hypothetical protein
METEYDYNFPKKNRWRNIWKNIKDIVIIILAILVVFTLFLLQDMGIF